MTDKKSSISYYEIEDGEYVVIEVFSDDDSLIQRIVIQRKAALQLAEGMLETLGRY